MKPPCESPKTIDLQVCEIEIKLGTWTHCEFITVIYSSHCGWVLKINKIRNKHPSPCYLAIACGAAGQSSTCGGHSRRRSGWSRMRTNGSWIEWCSIGMSMWDGYIFLIICVQRLKTPKKRGTVLMTQDSSIWKRNFPLWGAGDTCMGSLICYLLGEAHWIQCPEFQCCLYPALLVASTSWYLVLWSI